MITWTEFKEKWKPCEAAVKYIDMLKTEDCLEIVKELISSEKHPWAEWGLARLMTRNQAIEWACLCAESVLPIFENQFPNDKRPRLAIKAVRSGNTVKAGQVAEAATDAALSAGVVPAAWAAWSAAWVAWTLQGEARAAVWAVWAAEASRTAAEADEDQGMANLLLGVEILETGDK